MTTSPNYYHYGTSWLLVEPYGAFPLYWPAPFLAIFEPDEEGEAPLIYHGEDIASVESLTHHRYRRDEHGAYIPF